MAVGESSPARRIINHGSFLNDPDAEFVFDSFKKTEINFQNLWEMTKYQGYELFFLDLRNVDTSRPELYYIADAIMQSEWEVGIYGKEPLFYTVTPTENTTGGGGFAQTAVFNYRYYRIHKKGQKFGISNTITAQDISPAGSLNISESIDGSMFIDLGNIGTQNVWDAFNLGDNGTPWHIEGLKFITATQNGNSRVWVFVGNQRLGIDEGDWGGSNTTDPNYLAATQDDFHLVTNQPVVTPDLFITKSSKKWVDASVNSTNATELSLSQEQTCFSVNTNVNTEIKGFKQVINPSSTPVELYDGIEIIVKNNGINSLRLIANDNTSAIPFDIPQDLFIPIGEIYQFKYNKENNVIERVGAIPEVDKPVPFGRLRILKIESNNDNNNLEVGDRVVTSNLNDDIYLGFGEYIGGDPMELTSYDQTTIDYFDPQNP